MAIKEVSYPTTDLENNLRSIFSRQGIEVHGVLIQRGKMTVLIKARQTVEWNALTEAVDEAMRDAGIAYDNQVEIKFG